MGTEAQLVAVFNRLGGSSTASNVAGLSRLAVLAPRETLDMIVLEAAQSPHLHAPLHAALVRLQDFPLFKATPTEPTLLVQAIKKALYPSDDDQEAERGGGGRDGETGGWHNNVGSSSGSSRTAARLSINQCEHLAAFVKLLLMETTILNASSRKH